MNYLAISRSSKYVSYAIFKDVELFLIDTYYFKEFDSVKRLKEWNEFLKEIIRNQKISVVVIHELEKGYSTRQIKELYSIQAVIQLTCLEMRVAFIQAKTSGWEKYIIGKRITPKRKVKFINEVYGLDLEFNYKNQAQDIANSIILGEAIAHKRVFI